MISRTVRYLLWTTFFTVLGACSAREPTSSDRESISPTTATTGDNGLTADPESQADSDGIRWHYRIAPSADLKTLTVRACFPGRLPTGFNAQMPAARWSLVAATQLPDGRPLQQQVTGMDISPLAPGDCVQYRLDLDKVAARADNNRRIRRVGAAWYISPDYWLWQPLGGPM